MKFIINAFLFSLITTTIIGNEKPKLTDFGENVYSQFGEDGIIKKIFQLIGTSSKVAVEFGAADGFWLSNTANLWAKDPAWSAILIEADPSKFNKLVKNTASYSCTAICKAVGTSPKSSLEAILEEVQFDSPIDLLSIDIDGNDYYIFQSLEKIRPRVIICEYNPSIPAHLDVYPDKENYIGCSVAALQREAAEKDYSLVAITDTNCIFVQNCEISKFSDFDIDRDHMSISHYTSYIICDYSGRYKVIGSSNFREPWGWDGASSTYNCNGDVTVIPKTVRKR